MKRTKSSRKWLQEHFEDIYVKKAQAEGYRSRAVYKLQEINIKEKLLKPGMTVIDLGAAPGGWTQYVSECLHETGRIIALDILPMDFLPGVEFICGDFREDSVMEQLRESLRAGGAIQKVDLILSDMAPNISGNKAIDAPRALHLVELAFELAQEVLKPGGTLLVKMFQSAGFEESIKQARALFDKIAMRKPLASRPRSKETYLLAKGYNL